MTDWPRSRWDWCLIVHPKTAVFLTRTPEKKIKSNILQNMKTTETKKEGVDVPELSYTQP